MAGSFGFEDDHYDVSMKVGEHALLPKVRETSAADLIIADGFSCREQIVQGTGREAVHLAEVMADAVRANRPPVSQTVTRRHSIWKPVAAGAAAALVTALLLRKR